MEAKLNQDICYMLAERLLEQDKFGTAIKLASTCKASYGNLFKMILKADLTESRHNGLADYRETWCMTCGFSMRKHGRLALSYFVVNNNIKMLKEYLSLAHIHAESWAKSFGPIITEGELGQGSSQYHHYWKSLTELAVLHCDKEVVLTLLKAGAFELDEYSQTKAIEAALSADRLDVIMAMLEYGGWLSKDCDDKSGPYLSESFDELCDWLRFSRSYEMAKLVIKISKSTQKGLANPRYNLFPNLTSSKHDPYNAFKACLEHGASVDATSYGYEEIYHSAVRHTALNGMCGQGNVEAARLLINAGANLRGAARFHHRESLEDEVDERPDDRDWRFEFMRPFVVGTPLHNCLQMLIFNQHCKHYKPIAWQSFGNRPSPEDTSCHKGIRNPAHALLCNQEREKAMGKALDVARVLLEHGADDSSLWDTDGKFLEDLSQQLLKQRIDNERLWMLFIDNGMVDVTARNKMGQTLLSQIVSRCADGEHLTQPPKPRLVRFLVHDRKADPNAVDNSGLTPLHYAILYEDIETIRTLLELGVDPMKSYGESLPPIFYAYGVPFPYKGPVMTRIINRLVMKRLNRKSNKKHRNDPKPRIDKTHWNPIVTRREGLSPNLLEILAKWAEKCHDEEGRTPLMVAESLSLLERPADEET